MGGYRLLEAVVGIYIWHISEKTKPYGPIYKLKSNLKKRKKIPKTNLSNVWKLINNKTYTYNAYYKFINYNYLKKNEVKKYACGCHSLLPHDFEFKLVRQGGTKFYLRSLVKIRHVVCSL